MLPIKEERVLVYTEEKYVWKNKSFRNVIIQTQNFLMRNYIL